MLGWQPQPTYAELIGYFLYLIPALAYVLWPARREAARAARDSGHDDAAAGARGRAQRLRLVRRRYGWRRAKQVALKLTDAGCSPATLKLDAGRTTFKVTNAGTGRVSELELLKGSRILGEKENLVAGLSGLVHADAAAGPVHAQLPRRRRRRRPAW